VSPKETAVAWLWTDTLACLLMEHDSVAPELLRGWIRRPIGVRIAEGNDPLELARALLAERRAGAARFDGAAVPTAPSM